MPFLDFFKAKFAPKFDHLVNIGAQNFNELVVEFKGIKVPGFGKGLSVDVDLKDLGKAIDKLEDAEIGDSLSSGLTGIGNSLSEIDFDPDFYKGSEIKVESKAKTKSE